MEEIVAIVGRPNVGKSTLFNRIIGKRIAIVHPESGVTRDRNYGEAEWTGKKFFLIDTGGFVPDSDDKFNKHIREQVKIAIEEADKVIFVVDGEKGLHPVDAEIGNNLRKHSKGKEIFLVVNKIDTNTRDVFKNEFFKLGLGDPYAISALSGKLVAELLDDIVKDLVENEDVQDDRIKFAIIGKPNAGKSSIVNALLKEERNIVTDIPGTTRDSIDSVIKFHGESLVLIDTAGLRRKSKATRSESIEFFSAIRTYKAIEKCDVAILVIDATDIMAGMGDVSDLKHSSFKLDKQDIRIIDDVLNYKKGLLVAINKWDLIEKDSKTSAMFATKITEHLKSNKSLKFIFISALTKQRIHKVIEEAKVIYDERNKLIKTSALNEVLLEEIKRMPPQAMRGKEIKINYITQLKAAHPIFGFFTNEPTMIAENYKRYLEKKIREHFGFAGVPISIVFKKKN
jgi:GTP-binding protein